MGALPNRTVAAAAEPLPVNSEPKHIAHALRALGASNHPAEMLGAAFYLRNALNDYGLEKFARWVETWALFEREVRGAAESEADRLFWQSDASDNS